MSQMPGSFGTRRLSDKEIAEDILTSQKYISNYYYAPAILESANNDVRTAFRELHNDKQFEAKQVFDYMSSRGWYAPRPADVQDMNGLRSAAQEARQAIAGSGISVGVGPTSYGVGNYGQHIGQGFRTQDVGQAFRGQNVGQTFVHNYGEQAVPGRYFTEEAGEGQGSYGPSSLSQGARWGGQPSWMQGGQPIQGYSGGRLPQWAYGSATGHQGPHSGTGWTGTQQGEGQSGYGPSSLSQGVRWGGEPSWTHQFTGGISGGIQGGNVSQRAWTGTQAGEGQPGYGPSSLAQGTRWGGQSQAIGQRGSLPSWAIGAARESQQMSQFGQGLSGQSFSTGEGMSGYGPSSLSQGVRWGGEPSWMGSSQSSFSGNLR